MDLRSFSQQDNKKAFPENERTAPEEQNATESDVHEAISHYSKMSNEQLMMELAKQVGLQKQKGNGSNIAATIEQIKPFLNEEQKTRLAQIIKSLGI